MVGTSRNVKITIACASFLTLTIGGIAFYLSQAQSSTSHINVAKATSSTKSQATSTSRLKPKAPKPSSIVGSNWTVMAPFKEEGSSNAENMSIVDAEEDPRYSESMFIRGGAVVFWANAGGIHSEGSVFARSELRELDSQDEDSRAKWSSKSGRHKLTGTYSVTRTLEARPQVCFAQIHNSKSDVLELCFDRSNEVSAYWSNKSKSKLLGNVIQGQKFETGIEVFDNTISVSFNGAQVLSFSKSSDSMYFKSGCYLQSNPDKYGENPFAAAEVTIYSISVTHDKQLG